MLLATAFKKLCLKGLGVYKSRPRKFLHEVSIEPNEIAGTSAGSIPILVLEYLRFPEASLSSFADGL